MTSDIRIRLLGCVWSLLVMSSAAHGSEPPYNSEDADCAMRMCSVWWRGDPTGRSECRKRFYQMLSEMQASPYHTPAPSRLGAACGTSDVPGDVTCRTAESRALAALLGAYESLAERRAVHEMRTGEAAPRLERERWLRLRWCYDHYRPRDSESGHLAVLRCFEPGAASAAADPTQEPRSYPRAFQRQWPQCRDLRR